MIIVTGLPRSGTSLMMNILKAGGLELSEDKKRGPDINNPKGYFEVENIGGKIKENPAYLEGKRGCIKILSPFLKNLKIGEKDIIIFMERDLEECFLSMGKMSKSSLTEEERKAFQRHLGNVKRDLEGKNIVYISYNLLLENPRKELMKLKGILPPSDLEKGGEVIDLSLYRNKKIK